MPSQASQPSPQTLKHKESLVAPRGGRGGLHDYDRGGDNRGMKVAVTMVVTVVAMTLVVMMTVVDDRGGGGGASHGGGHRRPALAAPNPSSTKNLWSAHEGAMSEQTVQSIAPPRSLGCRTLKPSAPMIHNFKQQSVEIRISHKTSLTTHCGRIEDSWVPVLVRPYLCELA
jgi:hypothetical protein